MEKLDSWINIYRTLNKAAWTEIRRLRINNMQLKGEVEVLRAEIKELSIRSSLQRT